MTDLSGIRFGYGFGPRHAPVTRRDLLAPLAGTDRAAESFPGPNSLQTLRLGKDLRAANRKLRDGDTGAQEHYDAARTALRVAAADGLRAAYARILEGQSPLRERLTWFWADHFTAAPTNLVTRAAATAYVDEAIRPHVAGRFADMLKAVTRHPMMLVYLDQAASVGPDSRVARRTGRGLNENLARELLELHTLGVEGGYSQADVRQAAELLTGLSVHPERGFIFRPNAAQPGAETVLGQSYGSGQRGRLEDIDRFLEDLAAKPQTARHIASKLATHFVADDPPAALVSGLEATFRDSDGDLAAVTEALVTHPDSTKPPLRKVKTPMDYIASTLVAFGITGAEMRDLSARQLRRLIVRPMTAMAQPFMRPPGPDGWPEAAAHWITPQGLATRISWATAVAARLQDRVDDPRTFLDETLGVHAGADVRFAVSAAETRAEGIALVLASAEFNRR